jgi:hypothetical protein
MKFITIVFGVLLIMLGVWSYISTDMISLTALIPALFGLVIGFLGLIQGRWKHNNPLFGAVMLSILGFLSTVRGLITFLSGGESARPAATLTQAIMAGLCLLFVILAVVLIKDFWKGWKAFGHFLGNMVARVVLTIFYFTVFMPFGLGVKLFSDPLQLKAQPRELWRSRHTGDQNLNDVLRQF